MDLRQLFDTSRDGSPAQIADLSRRFGGRMPDPEMAAVLRVMVASDPKPFHELPPKIARRHPTPAMAVKMLRKQQGHSADPEPVGNVEVRYIPGPAGAVDVRIYRPAGAAADRLLPAALYIHGGGWVIAGLATYDASARAITNGARCVVVATHYRQAPEHKYPAAHDDTFAAYHWLRRHAHELGIDPERIAIVGESAGGNMAANVCIRARDENSPMPVHQVLVYPIAGFDTNTVSYREMGDAVPLNKPAMEWFFANYLNDPSEGRSSVISLVDADLAGLPPATVINAELDPLRTEGETLADRLQAAGVPASQRTYPGVTHEFFGMGAVLAKARDAQQVATAALRRAFDR